MQEEKFISWNEDKTYSLVSGGLIYSLLLKLGILKHGKQRLLLRSIVFSLLGWLPLIILSFTDGTFLGEDGQLGVAQDFLLHIRLLVVVPFLIWVEKMIDPAFNDYMNSTRRLIPPKEEATFRKIETQTEKMSDSWIPEIFFLLLIYGVLLFNWGNITVNNARISITDSASDINLSAIYYIIVSMPVYQLLLARWFWRWIIWAITVYRISRMNLRIEASHADQSAGLEYLNVVPAAFCIVSLALSAIFAATIGEYIIYHGKILDDFVLQIIAFAIAIPLIVHLPLLSFIPLLIMTKVNGIYRFGSLIQYHNNLYREKWMEGNMPDDDNLLPSLDNSSMADINGSYLQAVKAMTVIPINRNALLISMLMLLIPFFPLIFTKYSLAELFSELVKVISG